MNNNSEFSIDDLIKRIYKSYIEIKVGEFREIDRDMLLSDIGLLYTSIKNLYPSNEVSAIEFDLSQKALNLEFVNDKSNPDFNLVPNKKKEEINEQIVVPKEKESLNENHIQLKEEKATAIDLSLFEDAEQLSTSVSEDLNLIDRKSDNTNSPVLKGFQLEVKVNEQKLQDLQDIPKIVHTEHELETSKEVEIKSNIEPVVLEQDKKSKSDIMDFLHHDDKKTSRDIYSFLDLNTRIGLIELFFKGNSMELTECLVWLNKLDTKEACLKVIDKFAVKFGVDKTEDIYKQFVGLVDRKLEYSK